MKRLPDLENNILVEMHSDAEYCINYKWLSHLGEPAELKKAIKHLKELDFLEFHRGLMTEDGEVAGAGWCRSAKGNNYVEEFEL